LIKKTIDLVKNHIFIIFICIYMDESNKDISITPVTVTRVTVIDKFVIKKVDVKLKENAEIIVDLVDNTGNYAGTKFLVISGEDYTNWGSDDDYIINWIKNNLNI